MFGFRKKSSQGIKHLDKVITGIVLGGIIAGAFGLRKKKEVPVKKPSFNQKIMNFFQGKGKK